MLFDATLALQLQPCFWKSQGPAPLGSPPFNGLQAGPTDSHMLEEDRISGPAKITRKTI